MPFAKKPVAASSIGTLTRILWWLTAFIVLAGAVMGYKFFHEFNKPKTAAVAPVATAEDKDVKWVQIDVSKLPGDTPKEGAGQEPRTTTPTGIPGTGEVAQPEKPATPGTGAGEAPKPEGVEATPTQGSGPDLSAGLKDVKDAGFMEEKPFQWLLGEAAKMYGQVDEAKEDTVPELYANPGTFRGKMVKVYGVVEAIDAPTTVGGAQQVQLGYLRTSGGVLRFYVPNALPVIKAGDRARIHGVFMKIEKYEDKQVREAAVPAVVATYVESMEPSANAEGSPFDTLRIMVMALVVMMGLWVLAAILRRKKQSQHYDRMEKWRKSLEARSRDDEDDQDEGTPNE